MSLRSRESAPYPVPRCGSPADAAAASEAGADDGGMVTGVWDGLVEDGDGLPGERGPVALEAEEGDARVVVGTMTPVVLDEEGDATRAGPGGAPQRDLLHFGRTAPPRWPAWAPRRRPAAPEKSRSSAAPFANSDTLLGACPSAPLRISTECSLTWPVNLHCSAARRGKTRQGNRGGRGKKRGGGNMTHGMMTMSCSSASETSSGAADSRSAQPLRTTAAPEPASRSFSVRMPAKSICAYR